MCSVNSPPPVYIVTGTIVRDGQHLTMLKTVALGWKDFICLRNHAFNAFDLIHCRIFNIDASVIDEQCYVFRNNLPLLI